MNMRWPYQHTPYLSALPGLAGYGMDVTAGDKPSKIYIVTSLENKKEGGPDPRGPNCFSGTFWWCWAADQGADFHKFMVDEVGGYAFLGRGLLGPERGNFDYIGHSAPGAGLFVQTGTLTVRGSNSRIWHCPSWVGDYPSTDGPEKYKADQRDSHQGSNSNYETARIAHINCEGCFSMDETVQFWYATAGISWLRGAIFAPLHSPPNFVMPDDPNHDAGVDHGYGHLIGGRSDLAFTQQSLYADTTDRNPLVAASNYAHVNNLHYNHGRAHVARGEGVHIDDNGDYNAEAGTTMQANIVGNVSVRGPEQNDSLVLARVRDVTEGSSGHAAWNSVFGWPSPDSQAGMFHEDLPPNYLKPVPRRSAWPLGLGFDYDGVFKPCADPLHPTVQEGLAYVELMRNNAGCMPARRYLYEGGVNKVLDQIEAAIRGLTSGPQYVNTVAEAGGWPTVPEERIDSSNMSKWWHAPFPFGADRDEVLQSGLLVDGSSAAGLSKIRQWIANQYHFVMGR